MSRTLVISIDALITADIPVLRRLPHLGKLMERAAWAEDILCVYPTLTYPCHAAIVTGRYPDKNGICNNEKFQPLARGRADWYWFRDEIKAPTIIDIAKANGRSTATVTWPVMCASGADYGIGEIWAPEEQDDPTPWFNKANSPAAHATFEANKHLLRWMKTPQMDEFAAACAADIIRRHSPDLMLLHLSYLDHQRHSLGVHGDLEHAHEFIDGQIGLVLDALEETGGVEDVNVILLGDHGQLYCDRLLHINTLFRDVGWLREEDGVVADYRVYAAPCGFSAQIYLAPGMKREEVYQGLLALQRSYPECIERVFTREEAARLHLAGDFDFVLEAGERVCFSKLANAPEIVTDASTPLEYKKSVSNHGHLPQKGDKPPFILCGPAAKPGSVVRGGHLVDEAPTILHLMGLPAVEMDGSALLGLLQ